MKKILVFAYLRNNLGDDLFVCELLRRYSNTEFHIRVIDSSFGKPFLKYSNAIIEIVDNETFNNINLSDYDGFVYIGGSIFMEGGHVYNLDKGCYKFIESTKNQNTPFFYISSNYGPYQTDDYFNLSRKTFNICKDLCFRDKYSYELFKDIPNIRYAPDVAFTYTPSNLSTIKNTIGISLIDLEIRDNLKQKESEYINFINNNISLYLQQNKKVYLFSFCAHENDEIAIEKIYKIRKDDVENGNITVVKYKDDVDKFISIYQNMEYMICERFHSLVLSYVFGQKFYVISYSKKIDNIILELGLCEDFLEFENLTDDTILNLNTFNTVNYNNLQNIKNTAQNQFKALDLFLGKC